MANLEAIGPLEGLETTSLETFSPESVEYLQSIEGLKPENWMELQPYERLEVLRTLESRLAEIQGRPPLPVVAEPMDFSGFFDGEALHVNVEHINDPSYRLEVIDTVAHEGRHAYQQYAVAHPGFHPNAQEVLYWAANQQSYFQPKEIGGRFGPEYYMNQPVELDAWRYGEMTRNVFSEFGDDSPFGEFDSMLETSFAKVEGNACRSSLLEQAGDLWTRIKSGLDELISPATQMNILRAAAMAIAHHRV